MTCEHPGLRAGGEVSQMLFVEVWRVWQVENEGNWVAGWGGELDEPQWDDRVDVGCHSWSWRSQEEGLALGWGRGVQLWPSWVQVSGRGRLDGRDPAHLPVFLVPCLPGPCLNVFSLHYGFTSFRFWHQIQHLALPWWFSLVPSEARWYCERNISSEMRQS